MTGKKGRSGRRPGSLSWWRNPTALAGYHLNVLIETWLAGVPIQVGPNRWLKQPTDRRYNVPPRVMSVLVELAIEHVGKTYGRRPNSAAVRDWARRRMPSPTLRRKVRSTVDEREAAYQEYDERMTQAWNGEQQARPF
jgi:hypothetical protein